MQSVPNQRENEERDRAERENRGNGVGRIFLVGVNRSLCRNNGGDAADRRSNCQQGDELRRKFEPSSEVSHKGQRQRQFDEDKDEADAAQAQNVAKNKTRAEQNDSRLKPELVGGHAGAENFRHAHGVSDDEADHNGPKHVLNIGQNKMMRLAVVRDELLDKLARIPDGNEQKHSGNEAKEAHAIRARGRVRLRKCSRTCHMRSPSALPRDRFEDAATNEQGKSKREQNSPAIKRKKTTLCGRSHKHVLRSERQR